MYGSNLKKDLEMQNSKLQENFQHSQSFMDQSNKIDELERENRTLNSNIEYLKYFF